MLGKLKTKMETEDEKNQKTLENQRKARIVGDDELKESLTNKHYKNLLRFFAGRFAGTQQVYHDIMDEFPAIVWNCLRYYNGEKGNFVTYLSKAILRRIYTLRNPTKFPLKPVKEHADKIQKFEMLDGLNQEEQRLMTAYYWDRETLKNLAEQHCVSHETIRKKIKKAKKKLEQIWNEP